MIQYFVSLIQQDYGSRGNGHYNEPLSSTLSSNDIVDITGEGDCLNDEDEDEYDERYITLKIFNVVKNGFSSPNL